MNPSRSQHMYNLASGTSACISAAQSTEDPNQRYGLLAAAEHLAAELKSLAWIHGNGEPTDESGDSTDQRAITAALAVARKEYGDLEEARYRIIELLLAPLKDLIQMDCWIGMPANGHSDLGDQDGDMFLAHYTQEFMTSPSADGMPVRILIAPGAKEEDVKRVLSKVAESGYSDDLIKNLHEEYNVPFNEQDGDVPF